MCELSWCCGVLQPPCWCCPPFLRGNCPSPGDTETAQAVTPPMAQVPFRKIATFKECLGRGRSREVKLCSFLTAQKTCGTSRVLQLQQIHSRFLLQNLRAEYGSGTVKRSQLNKRRSLSCSGINSDKRRMPRGLDGPDQPQLGPPPTHPWVQKPS